MPEDRKEEVEVIITKVMEDHNLQQCQREFCNALARTIKNEYVDRDVGLVDYQIAVLKSILAAKIDAENPSDIFNDSIQRKKWVQTFVFNYLRQILRENKKALHTKIYKRYVPLEDHILNTILKAIKIDTIRLDHQPTEDGYKISINTFLLSTKTISMLNETRTMYFNDVEIIISPDKINIRRIGEQKFVKEKSNEQTPVGEQSFDQDDDGEMNARDLLEAKVTRKEKSMEMNTIDRLKRRVPEHALPVLSIYLEDDRPQQYIDEFGLGKPKIVHISKFLGLSSKEVKRVLSVIKLNLMVVDLGY